MEITFCELRKCLMATKKNRLQRQSRRKDGSKEKAVAANNKTWFLELSILFFILSFSQLGEVQKSHEREPANYKFFMVAFIISIAISFLFLGLYFGIKISEAKTKRENPTYFD